MSTSGSGPSGSNPISKKSRKNASDSRSDPGWEHGIEIDSTTKKVQCKYCLVIRSGGIYRLKHHLAGTKFNVEACTKVPEKVRNQFLSILQAHGEDALKKKRDIEKKDTREKACQQIARFFYTSAIPFNCVKNPEFISMVEAIGQHGPGMKPPSYNDIRVKYLKQEVDLTLQRLEDYKAEWRTVGCTIMSDGWSDRKRRSICNFLVNSPKGTVFLSSIDTSDIAKTSEKVFQMLDEVVEKVGEENVVQVVIDNASNYKAAGHMLMEKRKNLYWTPCAAHCIDLMLEDFEKKFELHKSTIAKGRKITTYIYSRTLVHAWLLEFTKGTELIRPAVTRFATAYLTLGCLSENKGGLMTMFTSVKWKSSRFAGSKEGKLIQKIVLNTGHFWSHVTICLKAAFPLIKVLRMVDSEGPMMGFIYEQMDKAKEKIQLNFDNIKKKLVSWLF
ncbi:hypothetical protein KSP39_PZI006677 [Platanthera zijinensis]|uniref:BED-type domain-containing protein n=1 Tax=Platanthera zijinensis TaxID=2320716 RepID=A0AAP0GA78_9ASPA